MAKKQWASFEDRVRDIAAHIWGRPCLPKQVGGVNIDGVVILEPEIHLFVEITENKTIAKVREDIIKLRTAKSAALARGITFLTIQRHHFVDMNSTNLFDFAVQFQKRQGQLLAHDFSERRLAGSAETDQA